MKFNLDAMKSEVSSLSSLKLMSIPLQPNKIFSSNGESNLVAKINDLESSKVLFEFLIKTSTVSGCLLNIARCSGVKNSESPQYFQLSIAIDGFHSFHFIRYSIMIFVLSTNPYLEE
ncbi:hypothetical protein WICMUC_004078 [Wickerhamomyces mucosus]|uniref:Uncharacterized protein n=1 Tax=Wickerhamomyces mucosus TaxID=1378264 RepID=A0A9P8TBC3_9ASCO|nr:hypothetical protein WICMUC_004078 [Wickerhamomyces mucosus]